MHSARFDRYTKAARCECADEHQLFGILTNIDKASGTRKTRPKLTHIQISLAIGLREPEKGCVQPAAVIKVELIGLIDNGLCVNRGSKIEPSCRHAANDARFGGKREQISNFLFVGDGCDTLGHADAEIDNAVCIKFESSTPCDDLSFAHFHRSHGPCGSANFAAKRRIILNGKSLPSDSLAWPARRNRRRYREF